jgi:hypothetical protein
MKHYDITQWTDFVRGISSTDRAAMEMHLSHCKTCTRTKDMLLRLVYVASSGSAPEVPEDVVRSAHAIFALRKPEKVTIANTMARLVYDSFRQPLPAGVRSQRSMSRTALYEAGDFSIDLRLEYQKSGTLVGLAGQVLSRKNPEKSVSGVTLMLKSGRKVLARTSTNQYGEFQMEYQPKTHLRLHIPIEDDCIEVPLGDVETGE